MWHTPSETFFLYLYLYVTGTVSFLYKYRYVRSVLYMEKKSHVLFNSGKAAFRGAMRHYGKRLANQAFRYATGSGKRKRLRARRLFGKRALYKVSRVKAANRSRRNRMDMKKVKCFINARTATHVRRERGCTRIKCLDRQALVSEIVSGGNLTSIEAAAGNLRYFDANTNTLVTKNPMTGTYSRDICMSIVRRLTLRNNYQVPCKLQVWSCIPKDATSVTAHSAWLSGLVDQGGISSTSPLAYISDSRDLTDMYSIKKMVGKTLMPGQSAFVRQICPKFDYTISTNDHHVLEYQKRQGGHIFLIRVTGVIAHDSGGVAECLTTAAGVDVLIDITYKFEYDAGKNLEDYSIDDNTAASFTTSGVLSSRPVVDNQTYSVA